MSHSCRPLRLADVGDVASLHQRAFPSFFLTRLGEPFLVQFYRGFIGDPTAVTAVAQDDAGRLVGAVVGTLEPSGFFRRLLLRRWPAFVLASVRAVVQSPAAAPRLLRAVTYRGGVESGTGGALLSSICVDPALRGHGIGRRLITAWTEAASVGGASRAFLTTDAEDNATTLRFYESCGWTRDATFRTPEGRSMHRYQAALEVRT